MQRPARGVCRSDMTTKSVRARIVKMSPTMPHPIRVEVLAGLCGGTVFCLDPDQAARAIDLIGAEVRVTFHPDDQFARVVTDVTIGNYHTTGIQDCDNAIGMDEFKIREGMRKGWTAEQIVDESLGSDGWQDMTEWLEQCDPADIIVHGADALWNTWKASWRATAIRIIGRDMAERCAVCGGRDEGNTCCDQPTSKRRTLVVRFDVTGWTDDQISALALEATAQGEDNERSTESEDGCPPMHHPDSSRISHDVIDGAPYTTAERVKR